jgi:hypothetical protein
MNDRATWRRQNVQEKYECPPDSTPGFSSNILQQLIKTKVPKQSQKTYKNLQSHKTYKTYTPQDLKIRFLGGTMRRVPDGANSKRALNLQLSAV